jgi:hypothetical protein
LPVNLFVKINSGPQNIANAPNEKARNILAAIKHGTTHIHGHDTECATLKNIHTIL